MEKIDYNVAVLEGKTMLAKIIIRVTIVIFNQKNLQAHRKIFSD